MPDGATVKKEYAYIYIKYPCVKQKHKDIFCDIMAWNEAYKRVEGYFMEQGELKMTYSGLLMKDGEKMVRVCFERGKADYAEGIVPRGTIEKSSGFTAEEVAQLANYLCENASEILNRAKDVNFLKEWMKKN